MPADRYRVGKRVVETTKLRWLQSDRETKIAASQATPAPRNDSLGGRKWEGNFQEITGFTQESDNIRRLLKKNGKKLKNF